MPQNTHIEMLSDRKPSACAEPPKKPAPTCEPCGQPRRTWREVWNGCRGMHSSRLFSERCRALRRAIRPVLRTLGVAACPRSLSRRFPLAARQQLRSCTCRPAEHEATASNCAHKLPHVRTPDGAIVPRVLALAEGFLATVGYEFSELAFTYVVKLFNRARCLDCSSYGRWSRR